MRAFRIEWSVLLPPPTAPAHLRTTSTRVSLQAQMVAQQREQMLMQQLKIVVTYFQACHPVSLVAPKPTFPLFVP